MRSRKLSLRLRALSLSFAVSASTSAFHHKYHSPHRIFRRSQLSQSKYKSCFPPVTGLPYYHQRWACVWNAKQQSSRFVVSVANSPSTDSDINRNIEELESLRRERQSLPLPDTHIEQSAPPKIPDSQADTKQLLTPKKQPNANPKLTIKSILHSPVGGLNQSTLNGLCNSIRHTQKGKALNNLKILERILVELDYWDSHRNSAMEESGKIEGAHVQRRFDGDDTLEDVLNWLEGRTFLKPIHVFPLLKALYADIRTWKRKQFRGGKKKHTNRSTGPRHEKIGAQDIKCLIKVVTLLRKQNHSNTIDPGCYTKDVPSFATMIAAEASRWEASAVDAALLFVDMLDKEGEADEWDPRLIGAVLDALARVGRAEDAQRLLGRALGVNITNVGNSPNVAISTGKSMNPSQAGPCFDALLRAYSNQALLLARSSKPEKPSNKHKNVIRDAQTFNSKSAASSLAQARHILLNHMPQQAELAITNRTCAAVLQGYSSLGMGLESERILMELEALHMSPLYSDSQLETSSSSTFSSSLDAVCYNSVLHAYSQSQDNNVANAERLFVAMKKQTPLNIAVANATVIPPQAEFISYSSMLNCYCKHGMVQEAEVLLVEMHEIYKPNAQCYIPILTALEQSDATDVPERVLSLLERSEGSLSRPNRLIYTAALRCMRRHGSGEEAEIVLDKFHDAFPNRGCPDIYSYMLVLMAYEKAKPADLHIAAKRAKVFLEKMEQMVNDSLLPRLDVNAYNVLLNCYARAGEAEKAERLLSDLNDNTTNVRPDGKSYSMVIKALAKSGADDAVDRAWEILYHLGYPKKSTTFQKPFNVSVDNFNSMLKLFAKRGMASEAETLLNKMDELVVEGTMRGGPDIQSYEAVLEALGRCADVDAPTRAEALVTRVEVMSEMSNSRSGGNVRKFQPSLLLYNTLLNCYANAGMAGKAERLLEKLDGPDLYSFGSTLKAIANSGKAQTVSMSSAVGTGNEIIKLGLVPNEITYAHRLKLTAKFGEGGEAEKLIRQMKKQNLTPSIVHYTAVLNAWAKSSDDAAPVRAEMLFKTMEDKFVLDRAAYHGLLLNYSTRGVSKKARRLLQRMVDSPDVQPNRNTFTMVIDSYARSNANNAGLKAEEVLNDMRELHAAGNDEVEPDDITYASVIRCMQGSKNKNIQDLSTFEKIALMSRLQIETWPFA